MIQFKRYHLSENFLDHISWWEYFSKTLISSAVCQAQSEILYKPPSPHHNTKKLLLPIFSFCKRRYPGLPKVSSWAGAQLKHILFQCKKKSKKCMLWLSVICQEQKKIHNLNMTHNTTHKMALFFHFFIISWLFLKLQPH